MNRPGEPRAHAHEEPPPFAPRFAQESEHETALNDICAAITEVTGFQASSWQAESRIRGLAIQVQANGDRGQTLRDLCRRRGKPYNLTHLLADYQQDKAKGLASQGTSPLTPEQRAALTWEVMERSRQRDEEREAIFAKYRIPAPQKAVRR